MDPNRLFTAAVEYLLLLLAISVREAAHAWAADRCGDPTARELGKVTLNPARHLDPVGSLFFPALLLAFGFPLFGWGRPTPVLEERLRNPGRDPLLVAAAGPAANVLLAVFAVFAIVVAVRVLGPEARNAGSLALVPTLQATRPEDFPVMFTLARMALLNVFLAAFHLMPVPPLDGGRIAVHLLPPDWGAKLAALRPYGFMIGTTLTLIGMVPLLLLVSGILMVVINFF